MYYAQLMNYALYDRKPEDMLAWPMWRDELYGPIHPVNSSLETLTTNLAFGRVWIAVYDEHMFGQPKFDLSTSHHQLAWMRQHLVADGEWSLPHLTLYRFKVPPAPERLWREGKASINLNHTLKNYRYLPELLHTQSSGEVLSAEGVRLRIPTPPGASTVRVEIESLVGRETRAAELTSPQGPLGFEPLVGGGLWTIELAVEGPLLDLQLQRSPAFASDHRGTLIRLTAR